MRVILDLLFNKINDNLATHSRNMLVGHQLDPYGMLYTNAVCLV